MAEVQTPDQPKCLYCGKTFQTKLKENIHRADCEKADFHGNGKIVNNPDINKKGENKVEQYRRKNQFQKQNPSNHSGQVKQ